MVKYNIDGTQDIEISMRHDSPRLVLQMVDFDVEPFDPNSLEQVEVNQPIDAPSGGLESTIETMSRNGADWSRPFSKTRIRPARSTMKSRSGSPGAVVRNVGCATRAMGSARIVIPPPPAEVCVKPAATPMAATVDNAFTPALRLIVITGSLSSKDVTPRLPTMRG